MDHVVVEAVEALAGVLQDADELPPYLEIAAAVEGGEIVITGWRRGGKPVRLRLPLPPR